MSDPKPRIKIENLTADRPEELTEEQAATAVGGATVQPKKPPVTQGAIEITDYGFDVSTPVTTS